MELRTRSVFCATEDVPVIQERRLSKNTFRLSCRDDFGNARLLDGVNIMDAIDQLCQFEEAIYGPLIKSMSAMQAGASVGGKIAQKKIREKKEASKKA